MFGWFKKKTDSRRSVPVDAIVLLGELNALIECKPKIGLLESLNPFTPAVQDESDPLSDASVYLAYGHIEQATNILREGLVVPGLIEKATWIPGGRTYAESVLKRLEALTALNDGQQK